MAVILGVSASIALISIAFGFVQKGVADENMNVSAKTMKLADSLTAQLQECKKAVSLGQIMAEHARKQADSLYKLSSKRK